MFNNTLFARLESQKDYENTRQTEILNPYVNFHKYTNTQTLADVMVAEAIQMRGVELYYIPREFVKPDMIFGEDVQSKFTKAWKFAAYINSFDGYEGAGNFFSSFGYQANDELTFTVNPNLFKHQVDDQEPKSGDLIYIPMSNDLFEINYVEPYQPFFQAGKNAMRKIIAEKFVYCGEELRPELQRNEGINVDEFADLDLAPITNLDGLTDINLDQYKEDKQFRSEGQDFIDPFDPINGKGSPFADF